MLKLKVDKLELRSKVCQFVGYPKGTREHYFSSQVDQKVFVSTNVRFLEKNFMISNMETHDIDKKTLEDTPTLAHRTMSLEIPTPTTPVNYNTLMTHHSGRFFIQPKRFMYLGESFEAIPKEHETNLTDYDETMCNDDDILWQGVMEVELESMYSS